MSNDGLSGEMLPKRMVTKQDIEALYERHRNYSGDVIFVDPSKHVPTLFDRVKELESQVEVMKKSIILLTREKTSYSHHEAMYDLKPLVNKELMG